MIEMYSVKLEDGLEYLIVETVTNNDDKYLILAKEDNDEEITIRKVVTHDGKECLTKLNDRDEFDMVMTLFNKKYKKEGENEE